MLATKLTVRKCSKFIRWEIQVEILPLVDSMEKYRVTVNPSFYNLLLMNAFFNILLNIYSTVIALSHSQERQIRYNYRIKSFNKQLKI